LREYTQVIIKESDRLQTLVDRLLAPHRRPQIVGDINIHEVFERVRSLIMAEFPQGLAIRRDYDLSLPDFRGDKEQLIQAVLNIAHNAAQALAPRIAQGDAELIFRSRIARSITLAKVRYRLALDLHIIDNGPGIPAELKDKIFYPLVSGRDGGSGGAVSCVCCAHSRSRCRCARLRSVSEPLSSADTLLTWAVACYRAASVRRVSAADVEEAWMARGREAGTREVGTTVACRDCGVSFGARYVAFVDRGENAALVRRLLEEGFAATGSVVCPQCGTTWWVWCGLF
jgi:hypothetical protein